MFFWADPLVVNLKLCDLYVSVHSTVYEPSEYLWTPGCTVDKVFGVVTGSIVGVTGAIVDTTFIVPNVYGLGDRNLMFDK